jgi:hypothetical protein
MTFLSKAERDFLISKDQVNHHYYCVKSRLLKKLNTFTSQELPLLIEKGYLAEFGKQQQDLAENCKVLNGSKRAVRDVAPRHTYAPRSGGKQCK